METGKLYEVCWREFTVKEEEFRIDYKRTRLAEYFELCKLLGIKTMLDAGCGSGINCNLSKEQGIVPTGFDLNTTVAGEKTKGVRLIQGNLENLPFKDREFDAAISMNVVHHTDETKTVPELIRVVDKMFFISLYGRLSFLQKCVEETVRMVCRIIPHSSMAKILRALQIRAFERILILDGGYIKRQERYSEKRVLEMIGNDFFCIFRRYNNLVSCIAIRKEFLKEALIKTNEVKKK